MCILRLAFFIGILLFYTEIFAIPIVNNVVGTTHQNVNNVTNTVNQAAKPSTAPAVNSIVNNATNNIPSINASGNVKVNIPGQGVSDLPLNLNKDNVKALDKAVNMNGIKKAASVTGENGKIIFGTAEKGKHQITSTVKPKTKLVKDKLKDTQGLALGKQIKTKVKAKVDIALGDIDIAARTKVNGGLKLGNLKNPKVSADGSLDIGIITPIVVGAGVVTGEINLDNSQDPEETVVLADSNIDVSTTTPIDNINGSANVVIGGGHSNNPNNSSTSTDSTTVIEITALESKSTLNNQANIEINDFNNSSEPSIAVSDSITSENSTFVGNINSNASVNADVNSATSSSAAINTEVNSTNNSNEPILTGNINIEITTPSLSDIINGGDNGGGGGSGGNDNGGTNGTNGNGGSSTADNETNSNTSTSSDGSSGFALASATSTVSSTDANGFLSAMNYCVKIDKNGVHHKAKNAYKCKLIKINGDKKCYCQIKPK